MCDSPTRILLIYPPSRSQIHLSCPMGLQMLAAVLEKAGCEVRILDANAAMRKRSVADIVEEAKEFHPDVISITLLTPLVKEAYKLADALKPCGVKLIAGGPHATLLPEEPLAHGFDAVVVGEGEPTIVEAIEALLDARPLDGVEGLVYRDSDGRVHGNADRPPIADLDTLPLPARHLIAPEQFGSSADGDLHAPIFTSRGCPARCAYCAGGLFGKKFRFRSADNVVDEMILIHERYGTHHFYFVDDAMSMDRPRMRRICDRLIDEHLGFTWHMMTRIDTVDEDLLDRAARAGCKQIEYGVESGSAETLKKIHKPHTADMVRRVIPLTHRYGIQPVTFFIVGFPWETEKDVDETFQLMRDIAPYVVFLPAIASIIVPFPGTEIYELYKDEYGFANWWLSDDRCYDAPQVDTHAFYERALYRVGAVLDADFFHYSRKMKAKIHEIFRFMLATNLQHRSLLYRTAYLGAVDLSKGLESISPALERAVFSSMRMLKNLGRR